MKLEILIVREKDLYGYLILEIMKACLGIQGLDHVAVKGGA